jgi:hypothetical protein
MDCKRLFVGRVAGGGISSDDATAADRVGSKGLPSQVPRVKARAARSTVIEDATGAASTVTR